MSRGSDRLVMVQARVSGGHALSGPMSHLSRRREPARSPVPPTRASPRSLLSITQHQHLSRPPLPPRVARGLARLNGNLQRRAGGRAQRSTSSVGATAPCRFQKVNSLLPPSRLSSRGARGHMFSWGTCEVLRMHSVMHAASVCQGAGNAQAASPRRLSQSWWNPPCLTVSDVPRALAREAGSTPDT